MNKLSKILFIVWAVLAIACFVGAFFTTPFIVKLAGIVFGIENMMIILSLVISLIQERIKYRKQQMDFEKEEIPEKE